MKQAVRESVGKAFAALARAEAWGQKLPDKYDISIPKEGKFGDFSTNLAMILASRMRMKPRDLAVSLAGRLKEDELFESVEVAGPGFINLWIRPVRWVEAMCHILDEGGSFGRTTTGGNEKVMVEYVSANPTGPLHVGHGRGAAVGDTLANILDWAGYDVTREYYTNDVGLQMDNLGRSTIIRARELAGEKVEEEPAYKGEYMIDVARAFLDEHGTEALSQDGQALLDKARKFAAGNILDGIKKDLDDFGVRFDNWFSEATLHSSGQVESLLEMVRGKGGIYEKDGALWLKTEGAGDEKDRVVKRANGLTTYLAADIAYHNTKLERNFTTMVNIWGADHHGYIPRMKAVISALGGDPEALRVVLVQLVSLKRGGQTVAMSTREGVFTTLKEVVNEVGKDAARFFFIMRSSDSHLDFDLDLAKKETSENPVYYIQYAHARCASVFTAAGEKGLYAPEMKDVDPGLLSGPDDLKLIRKLLEFPWVVEGCALGFSPHLAAQYLTELAGVFHYYYKHNRIVGDDEKLSLARLALVRAVKITVGNGLRLLGVSAPEKM